MQTELREDDSLKYAPINLVAPETGFNPRTDVVLEEAFLGSIQNKGILSPLFVRNNPKIPGHFLIVDGERRYRAAKQLQLEELPVIILSGDTEDGELGDADALLVALMSNEHKELPLIDKARAYSKLKALEDINNAQLAEALGVSDRTLKETLVVIESNSIELQQAIKAEEEEERIPTRVAARAASLPEEVREEIIPKLKGQSTAAGLTTVREAEADLGKVNRGRPPRLEKIDSDVLKVFAWASDAKKRAERLYNLTMSRLTQDPADERALAHLELIWVLQGDREVSELYPREGESSKKLASSTKLRKKEDLEDVESDQTKKRAKRASKRKTKEPQKKVVRRKTGQKATLIE